MRRFTPFRPFTLSLLVLAVLGSAAAVRAQEPEADDAAPSERLELHPGASRHRVPRVAGPVTVDARLDEVAWEHATRITLDVEIEPRENVAAPVETVCLVAHDDDHVYLAFRASDPRPSEIRARYTDRDSAFADDFVGVILDTFNDARRAFQFFVNPLGVQMDMIRDEAGGGGEDLSWDAIWESAGRITEDGYVVEIAIPFSSLRFQGGSGEQVWGFAPLRTYPRSLRHQLSSLEVDRDESCLLCQLDELVGFEGATPGRALEVNPTITAGRTDRRRDFPSGDVAEGSLDGEAGVTVGWGATPNVHVSGTLNPDFSQVEADVAQLAVNSRFALFFPEQRPFFQEGADFFNTPLRAVFTRTIADPLWGVRSTGKLGRGAFGVMVAEDEVTNLLLPGSQSSRATSLASSTTDAVLRYRRDLGESSTLGVLYTGREGSGYRNHLAGVDGLVRFDERNSVRFQALGSKTRYPREIVAGFDQPEGDLEDLAFRMAYDYGSRDWTGYLRYEDRGEEFRADLGFMPQVDTRFWVAGLRRNWIGDEDDWYTRISFGGDYDETVDQGGNLLQREAAVNLTLGGPWQSFGFLGLGVRERSFRGARFDETSASFFLTVQPTASVALDLGGRFGDDIDFANVRPAEVLALSPAANLRLGRHASLVLRHSFERLDVQGGRLFEANLSQGRMVYQFNVRTFVRAIVQYRTLDRTPALYRDPVEPESESLFTQLLFSYKLDPRTVLFVGYSDTRLGEQGVDLTQESRTFFLKLGYSWMP